MTSDAAAFGGFVINKHGHGKCPNQTLDAFVDVRCGYLFRIDWFSTEIVVDVFSAKSSHISTYQP